jgi:hypothetical protein
MCFPSRHSGASLLSCASTKVDFFLPLQSDEINFLAIFSGTCYSVSRLAILANVWNGTSAWDRSCHLQGPADKLESAILYVV